MLYYCLTLRKCTPIKTVKQLDRVIADYEYYIKNIAANAELQVESHLECVDKKTGYNVHLHAMIKTPIKLHAKQKKGFSIRLEECKSKAAWQCYITKDNVTSNLIRQHMYDMIEPPSEDSEEYINIPDAHPERTIYKRIFF